MNVKVYRNLRTKNYSVMNRRTGRIERHADAVLLSCATFKVSEAGRQRVLREKQKNVHAFVVGTDCGKPVSNVSNLREMADQGVVVEVTYNPYKAPTFVRKADGTPVLGATTVWVTPGGVFASVEGLVCGE